MPCARAGTAFPFRSRMSPVRPPSVVLVVALALSAVLSAQPGVPRPPGLVDEEMWPAATAEQWQRPVCIDWQRTWDDAVALARATGRPILACINMDGEIASEHYAGVRYRDPEICKLYEPYVCVVASVYRHTPRDHDAQGRRIPCPRFGGVTCGEHIAMEAVLFEKYMKGTRVAPRHIMIELDGSEVYDVYYTWDTDSVFRAIADGIQKRAVPTPPVVRGDRSLLERVASPDSFDRRAVEEAWLQGDDATRKQLLDAAIELGERAPIEVLRLAVFGLDAEAAARARQALARTADPNAVELIAATLRGPITTAERDALIEALGRLAPSSPKARMLATVHRGLAHGGSILAPDPNPRPGRPAPPPVLEPGEVAARADYAEAAARARPEDAGALLDLAESTLVQALSDAEGGLHAGLKRTFDRLRLIDAEATARRAEQAGAKGWRLFGVLAVTAVELGRIAEAYELAEKAAKELPPGDESRLGAEVLALFAEARQDAIARAAKAKQDWPPQFVADVNAAYGALARHPFGTAVHVAHHYDFLQFFGAAAASRVLDEGLARFPLSAPLHERLRTRLLAEEGPEALEAAYAERVAAPDAPPELWWFAGYASLVAAEQHRRTRRSDDALAAYDRGIAAFEGLAQASAAYTGDADHFVAMALAGKARIRMQLGALEQALADLEGSLARRADSAASPDGLGITAVDTARMLLVRLQEAQRDDLRERLQARLDSLDPALLEPPAHEREVDRRARRRRGR